VNDLDLIVVDFGKIVSCLHCINSDIRKALK
jgi:hypothetical protein